MNITQADVEHIARLARLTLDAQELERMTAQLNSILDHMRELREVDINGVPPFAIAAEDVAAPRADDPGVDEMQRAPAELAVAWNEGFFTVPRLEAQRGAAGDA